MKNEQNLAEAEEYAHALAISDAPHDVPIQGFVIPPFTAGRQVKNLLANTPVKVGPQNMHWAGTGAWTGEILPLMLTDCHLDMVELGH